MGRGTGWVLVDAESSEPTILSSPRSSSIHCGASSPETQPVSTPPSTSPSAGVFSCDALTADTTGWSTGAQSPAAVGGGGAPAGSN